MNLTTFRFLELNSDKIPITPFNKTLNYYEALEKENVGVVIEEPWVVLDVDDENEAELMQRYIENNGIKTAIMETTRGKHFWFKNDKKLKNYIGVQNAISIKCDVRSYNNKCFVMVKKNNVWREWVNDIPGADIDFLPKELEPINDKLLNQCVRLSMVRNEGEGRRNALFQRIIPLANNNFNQDELKELFAKMNVVFFNKPLVNKELENLFTDDKIFETKIQEFKNYFSEETKSFLHYKFAIDLNESLNGVYTNGSYYFYHKKYYTREERILFQKMNEIIPTLKQTQRVETLHYLKTLETKDLMKNEYCVSLENGVYDFKTDTFKEHNPKFFITNMINCKYDSSIKKYPIIDNFLNDITCNDLSLKLVLLEVLGYCFISNTNLQKAFILKGYGANGKSTFLDVIKEIFGLENMAAVGLEELQERFKRSALVDKMVNISSELPETSVNNLHIFKKLVTGDIIDAEFKGKDSFTFTNTAKFIFSANELPKMNDTSEGFIRRILIIPFKRYFNEEERDQEMLAKLTTDEAKSYWFNLAIDGWKRLKVNKAFTKSSLINKEMEDWSNSLNSIRRWFKTPSFNLEKYYGKKLENVYLDYQSYCSQYNSGKSMSVWKVKEELLIKFKNITIDDDNYIKEIKTIEEEE